MPKLKIALVHPKAVMPSYKSKKAAAFDIHVVMEGAMRTIKPGEIVNFRTGLKFGIPEGYRLAVQGRSGMWFKHGIRVGNNEGVIDEDFTGELEVSLHNCSTKNYTVKPGDRIAQAEFRKYEQAEFEQIAEDDLPTTERGSGGLGHTGR